MRTLAVKEPPHTQRRQAEVNRAVVQPSHRSLSSGVLQRKASCACGGGCPRCQEQALLQTKLKISEPGDRYEQEADHIANEVMRMPEPSVQRQVEPEEDEEEEMVQREAIPNPTSLHSDQSSSEIPSIVHEVINSSGQTLDFETRTFMESRFEQDFSQVRVHTDAKAAESARKMAASAYTMKQDIVFGAGQYEPSTNTGKRLLAHELTHVVQQKASLQKNRIQRQADIRQAPDELPCVTATGLGHSSGFDFLFSLSSSTLTPTQRATIASFASSWIAGGAKDEVFVDGYASTDGSQSLNRRLSCDRAEIVKSELLANSIPSKKILTLAHGESTEFSTTSLSPNRRAILSSIHVPESVKPKCGPDVTTWFVDQVNLAMKDPAVLSIQSDLSMAARILAGVSVSASDIAEGSATAAIERQQRRLGAAAPARDSTINSQMLSGTVSAIRVSIGLASKPLAIPLAIIAAGLSVASAALKWRALVNHGARYDFKAHVMNHPKTAHCPDESCVSVETGVVTMCPGSASENCYESDLTGNIFYALIGKFVGFSELTLQLGSQLAELADTRVTPTHPRVTWDSPQDTSAIHLGVTLLPLPLTTGALCKVLTPARPALSHKAGCADCVELTTAPHT